jgi:hypothetical protein
VTRNVTYTVQTGFSSSIGGVRDARLELLRPLASGGYAVVATLFQGNGNLLCAQVKDLTRCQSADDIYPQLGGIELRGYTASLFQFRLLSNFPIGPLRLRTSADAQDLARYFVNGMPEALDLLPWEAAVLDVTVQ